MTTELEKQFFDTFGIEKIKMCIYHHCKGTFKDEEYPQITDRILLELICICSQYGFCSTARNIKDLKLKVLKRLLKLKKNLKNNYEHQGYHNAFTIKVQAIFEGIYEIEEITYKQEKIDVYECPFYRQDRLSWCKYYPKGCNGCMYLVKVGEKILNDR